MNASNTFIRVLKNKKREKSDDLSKNHSDKVKYRKRIQEDREKEKELKEFNAGREIQDTVRRDDFPF